MKDIADLLARIFIATIFIYEVYDTIAYYKQTKVTMSAYGIGSHQDVLLVGILIFLILGSFLVLVGYYSNIGAIFLLMYWLPFTCIVFSFWNDPDDIKRFSSLQFMRNMAICGGLLLLIANGAGKYSVKRMLHVLKLPKN